MTELAVIEIKPEQAPALYVQNGLDGYLTLIREQVKEVPDLSTAKGRARIASLASQVSRSKTAIEKPGRDYLRQLKEAVKPAEVELRRFVTECDALRDEVRRPLTEWEAEQERVKAEEVMNAMHAEALEMNAEFDLQLAARREADHEMALLMNEKFDRDQEEQRRLAEQAQRERDERLQREAADQAKRDAEEKHRTELEAAARREAEAREQAEREKREAIEAEQRKAREEAERIKREAEAKEEARLAEEKRVAEENARRAADVEHRRTINRRVIADLVSQGIPEDHAKAALLAIAGGKVPDAQIKY